MYFMLTKSDEGITAWPISKEDLLDGLERGIYGAGGIFVDMNGIIYHISGPIKEGVVGE